MGTMTFRSSLDTFEKACILPSTRGIHNNKMALKCKIMILFPLIYLFNKKVLPPIIRRDLCEAQNRTVCCDF